MKFETAIQTCNLQVWELGMRLTSSACSPLRDNLKLVNTFVMETCSTTTNKQGLQFAASDLASNHFAWIYIIV